MLGVLTTAPYPLRPYMARFGEDTMSTQSHPDSFKSLSTLSSSSFSQKYNFFRLKALEGRKFHGSTLADPADTPYRRRH